MTPTEHTYANSVTAYAAAGWPCILPVPRQDKFPPPVGYTGAEGADTGPLDLLRFSHENAGDSIALRMPTGVIGIDVDQYMKKGVQKHGAQTIARLEAQLGALPATWSSTARGTAASSGESRIRLYRVPSRRYATVLKATHDDGSVTGDVEIIQHHHRYAVVWPSPHAGAGPGAVYRWYGPDGVLSEAAVPGPMDLPELPVAWLDHLSAGATAAGPAASDVASGEVLLAQLLEDHRSECSDVTSARLTAVAKMGESDAGSRHDAMTARTHHLVQLGVLGHPGVGTALDELRQLWASLTSDEGRADEFERALLTSARKGVSVVGTVQVPRDPCLMMAGGVPLPAVSAADPSSTSGPPVETVVEPPRWAGPREIIGAEAFDPRADTDQTLAEAVLARTYPALRYAYDANGWLLRAPERWEAHGRLSPWAVAQVAPLMPVGDSTAEKGSDQQLRAARRARLLASGGARGVAGKMDDLVAGGMHPAAVALADLDSEPEILWAGGHAWDLKASTTEAGPRVATWLDPAMPHLHSAAVMPQRRPTPLWDDFLAAVWPSPEVRGWAIRVLAIALTGYSDRAMPVLLGETGRGKTAIVALMMSILGTYAHAANPKLLNANSNEHDTIVFDLKGRRLSFIDEAPAEAKAGQERLKQLTGGGELTGRRMNENSVTFAPTHTFVLTANDEPVLTDPAVRSRSRLIPCDGDPEAVRITRAAIGHVSGPAWRHEAPGVLAKLMAEAAAWLGDPTSAGQAAAPEGIRYLAEHLGAEQDPVAVWVAEETEPCTEGSASRELYQAFVASCRRNSMRPDAIPTETKWGRALSRLGLSAVKTKTGNRRRIRIRVGGFLPGMPAAPTVHEPSIAQNTTNVSKAGVESGSMVMSTEAAIPGGGLMGAGGGLVEGSNLNPPPAYPQVNPSNSPIGGGCGGLGEHLYAHTPAHTPVNSDLEPPLNPPTLHPEGVGRPAPAPKPKREQTPEAKVKAAEKREATRLLAIAEAEGGKAPLPALVTADGTVRGGLDLAALDQLLATITGTDLALTVDVETSGFPVGHQHYALRTIQLGGLAFAVVLDAADPEHAEVARKHLAAASVLHAHSASADLVPLAHAELSDFDDAWARMVDTVVLAKLADPTSTGSDPGLKQLSKNVLGEGALSPAADVARSALFKAGKWLTDTKITTAPERSGWLQVNSGSTTMVRYAASDVLDDARLALVLPRPEPEVLERERLVQQMTSRVALVGVRLDPDHIDALRTEHLAGKVVAAEQVQAFGIENPGSNTQVAAAFSALGHELPRTATGRASVAEAVVAPLKGTEGPVGDLARAVLEYRHHETALGTFLEPYHQLVVNGDGRARPTVYTLGTDTGRMSCVRPNIQQLSREGGIRACLTADPGSLLISADFSGVELRVAAGLSGDPQLTQMILSGGDLHAEVARQVWGPGATKAHRYQAKRVVFGRLYGGGVGTLASQAGISEPVAQQAVDALDALTPGLAEWSRLTRDGVRSGRTQFRTYSGRIVHLPAEFPHKAPNYCIQGSARELLVDALVRWSGTRWGTAVLFPVHDELVVQVPEAEAEEATAALVECMSTTLLGVPIVAEPSAPSFAWEDSV